jgi:hypothetical protein
MRVRFPPHHNQNRWKEGPLVIIDEYLDGGISERSEPMILLSVIDKSSRV